MNTFFNAHHSPIGAFASMTFGCKGSRGGLAAELKGPADESIFVGVEESRRPGMYQCLPFFDGGLGEASAEDFDIEGLSDYRYRPAIFPFADSEITRKLGAATDRWQAGDLSFTVYTPARAIPDPQVAQECELKLAIVPAIIVELEVDNRKGKAARKAFLGYSGADRTRSMHVNEHQGMVSVGQGVKTLIASLEETVYGGVAWQPEAILDPRFEENLNFSLGSSGILTFTVPAGEVKTARFAIAFYNPAQSTTGIETTYFYESYFPNIHDVARYALENAPKIIAACDDLDERISQRLSRPRALTLGQAIKSYFGSTQLLRSKDGKPIWVVNEGEYRMMNTFDLTVDQLYFELALNPWTVRNVLDLFVERYSYTDEVRFPGSETTYPGGLAFTHDMGVANHFSPKGFSCYEQAGLKGVFSYMSCEELVNWILCACVYVSYTRDTAWLKKNQAILAQCLTSLINRDHPEPLKRNGVMSLDSARCKTGQEITTYDSLDKSLGQARNNVYLAVKTWAAYALMEEHFRTVGDSLLAESARLQARLCSETIVTSVNSDGYLPSVIGEGIDAKIIPAIEGLIFPLVAGRSDLLREDGNYGALVKALKHHLTLVLDKGDCLFESGGWKLSSTSNNSWLSKIYLCQFVAERIFGMAPDLRADNAHLDWLMDEDNCYYAWSDQMLSGKAHGSRYYPRGVTAVLWLSEGDAVIKSISEFFASPSSHQISLV